MNLGPLGHCPVTQPQEAALIRDVASGPDRTQETRAGPSMAPAASAHS
jgi:hypothetical protein